MCHEPTVCPPGVQTMYRVHARRRRSSNPQQLNECIPWQKGVVASNSCCSCLTNRPCVLITPVWVSHVESEHGCRAEQKPATCQCAFLGERARQALPLPLTWDVRGPLQHSKLGDARILTSLSSAPFSSLHNPIPRSGRGKRQQHRHQCLL